MRGGRLDATFGHAKVSRGSWVSWNAGGSYVQQGRVVGVLEQFGMTFVKAAPKRYLVVLAIGEHAHHAYLRYVKPEDVLDSQDGVRVVLQWMLGAGFLNTEPEVLFARAEYGSLSDAYLRTALNTLTGALLPMGEEVR